MALPLAAVRINRLDRFAIGLSGLCLVHCLGTTVMLAMLASAGGMLGAHWIHEVGLTLAMVMGAIVPVVNLEGIMPGELVLSGEVLGDIYLGKIKKWDDPAIAKLNPKLKLPADAITVVRRSDGSGTTFVFSV